MVIDFRDRGREKKREKHWCERETSIGCLFLVPWQRIRPGCALAIFPSVGWCSNHLSRTSQGSCIHFHWRVRNFMQIHTPIWWGHWRQAILRVQAWSPLDACLYSGLLLFTNCEFKQLPKQCTFGWMLFPLYSRFFTYKTEIMAPIL